MSEPASRSRIWLWVLIGGGAFFLFVLAVFTLVYVALHVSGRRAGTLYAFGDKIGVVDLEGVILDPSEVVDQLRKFADDDSIKAIYLARKLAGRRSRSFGGNLPSSQASA